ncbi:hypothetical protein [Paenibacillus sp. FSL R7-0652]|uniref:hypothetical protein n=1 Tax=Paenibacillus sp. FSL R7-0652 TaxID=2921687 RepID=UPI00315AB09E
MNISSMIRGLMGDSKPGNAKQLELKEGQVVRGSVVSVSDDGGEAVLQIQGVQVRAKLETPLRPGETTLLQVQPPGENGMTVMKPLAGSLAELPQASMNQLLQEVGLTDTKDNRDLLLAMQRSGLPLTKDNVTMVQHMMAAKPAQVPVEEWVQAAGIAFQRGLPVTAETVKGLHQTVFGPPLHQLLSSLADQLESMLSQTSGKPASGGEAAAAHTIRPGAGTLVSSPAALQQNIPGTAVPLTTAGSPDGAGVTGQQVKVSIPSDAGQTSGGQTGTEAGAKGSASSAEAAGRSSAGIPAGNGIPAEGPRGADAGQAVSRPGAPGAAEAAAGRAGAGQLEGAAVNADGRADTPAAAGTQSAAGQAAPAAPTPARLAPKSAGGRWTRARRVTGRTGTAGCGRPSRPCRAGGRPEGCGCRRLAAALVSRRRYAAGWR